MWAWFAYAALIGWLVWAWAMWLEDRRERE